MIETKYQNADIVNVNKSIVDILRENKHVIKGFSTDDRFMEDRLTLKKGLFVNGVVGSGKTYTFHAIKKAVSNWGKCSKVYNFTELLSDMKKDNFREYYKILEDLSEKDFIFLDDIGTEKESENVQEILYLIVDRAYRKESVMFISTNLDLNEFLNRYGERVMRRINEACVSINLKKKYV
jgi:DNA replication protein DnaC